MAVRSRHDPRLDGSVAGERIFHALAQFDRVMDLSSPYPATGYGALSEQPRYIPDQTPHRTTAMSRFLDEEPREGPNVAVAQQWMRFEEHLSPPISPLGPIPRIEPVAASPQPLGASDTKYVVLICQLIAAKYLEYGSVAHTHQVQTHGNGHTSTGQTYEFTTPSAGSPSRKRSVQHPDMSADEPAEIVQTVANRKKTRVAVDLPRMYACPCYRNDPDSLDFQPNGMFEKCRTEGIRPGKLKQHIRRIHTKPAQCPKCGRRGDHGDIRTHMDIINCLPNPAIITVAADTLHQENLLTKSGNTTWHAVFAILFPQHIPPPTVAAQYFVSEAEPGQNVGMCQDRLAHVLAAHLDSSATALQRLLSSAEYRLIVASGTSASGMPVVHAAAARLMAILATTPFVVGVVPATVAMPEVVTPMAYIDETFWETFDWDRSMESGWLTDDQNGV